MQHGDVSPQIAQGLQRRRLEYPRILEDSPLGSRYSLHRENSWPIRPCNPRRITLRSYGPRSRSAHLARVGAWCIPIGLKITVVTRSVRHSCLTVVLLSSTGWQLKWTPRAVKRERNTLPHNPSGALRTCARSGPATSTSSLSLRTHAGAAASRDAKLSCKC